VELSNRSAKKVPTINLVNSDKSKWTVASSDTYWNETSTSKRLRLAEKIPVKPNTQYKVKINGNYRVFMRNYGVGANQISDSGWIYDGYIFTTDVNMISVGFLVARNDDGNITLDELDIAKPMLAQGLYTVNIPYEEVNREAKRKPRKNLVKPFTSSAWELAYPFKVVSDYEGTLSSQNPAWDTSKFYVPVEAGKTYTVQAEVEGNFSVEVWENGKNYGAFTKNSTQSRYMKASYSVWELRVVRDQQAIGDFRIRNLMVSEGIGRVPFEPYEEINKKAVLVPKKNLISMDISKWQTRSNTTNVKIEGTKLSWEASATYGGANFFLEPEVYAGKTITFSRGEQNDGASAIVFYKTTDGTQRYMALDVADKLKVDVPRNVVELRYYVQNAYEAIQGKTYWVTDLQAEIGDTATPYEPYELSPKKSLSPIKKAPYKDYAFTFKRESVEMVKGVQYGVNNPRIINGGLMVEEGTVNLVPVATDWKVPWVSQLPAQYFPGFVRLTLDLSKGTIAGVKHSKYFSATAGKNYTIRFKARANRDGVSLNYSYFMGGGYSNGNKALSTAGFRPELTTEWKEYSFTTTYDSSTSSAHVLFGFYNSNGNENGDFVDFKEIQVEQKDYPTSVTEKDRKNEVPTLNVTLDRQAGSIETEFEYKDIPTKSQYVFDTVQNRWIFYKDAWDDTVYVYLDGVQCIGVPKSLLPEGKIKARIEWSNPNVSLYINGVLVGTGTYLGSNYTTKDIYLGTRYTIVEQLNNVIYSFKVTDRNGKIIGEI
jgi:hypothetical protein